MPPAAPLDVPLLRTNADEVGWIEHTIRDNFAGVGRLEVLEAGCGRAWYLDLAPYQLAITGVDLSEAALDHRMHTVGDLHAGIHGDLRTVDLAAKSFDLAYTAYVLEHVRGVADVLDNLIKWTRPGGLIVLRLPDRDTVFGLLARMTPYRSHVWFYRYVMHERLAGVDGRAPFPTHYEPAMGRRALRRFFAARGCEVVGERLTIPFMGRTSAFWRLVRVGMRVAGALTLGRWSGRHTNFTMIARVVA